MKHLILSSAIILSSCAPANNATGSDVNGIWCVVTMPIHFHGC